MQKKILVAMSGGVDSSVAALLLKNQGHEVAGITMCLQKAIYRYSDIHCGASRSVEDARLVCEHLDIKHFTVDFSEHLDRQVIDNFLAEYRCGRTPNPCVQCNRRVKFGLLLEKAAELGCDYFATGHYVAKASCQGHTVLRRSSDARKDQSYFLYAVKNEVLDRVVFPLAECIKKDVRAMARDASLPVSENPESQDICFIPQGNYREFFSSRHENIQPGDIVDLSGKILGRHKGIPFYTIGQRSGLGIAAPAPLYVIGIDAEKNRLIIGDKNHVRARRLTAKQLNIHIPRLPERGLAKIRYAHKPAACSFTVSADTLNLVFDELQEAITPGQSVVVYNKDMVVCGGIIDEIGHED